MPQKEEQALSGLCRPYCTFCSCRVTDVDNDSPVRMILEWTEKFEWR